MLGQAKRRFTAEEIGKAAETTVPPLHVRWRNPLRGHLREAAAHQVLVPVTGSPNLAKLIANPNIEETIALRIAGKPAAQRCNIEAAGAPKRIRRRSLTLPRSPDKPHPPLGQPPARLNPGWPSCAMRSARSHAGSPRVRRDGQRETWSDRRFSVRIIRPAASIR